jgi:hypothetical protein
MPSTHAGRAVGTRDALFDVCGLCFARLTCTEKIARGGRYRDFVHAPSACSRRAALSPVPLTRHCGAAHGALHASGPSATQVSRNDSLTPHFFVRLLRLIGGVRHVLLLGLRGGLVSVASCTGRQPAIHNVTFPACCRHGGACAGGRCIHGCQARARACRTRHECASGFPLRCTRWRQGGMCRARSTHSITAPEAGMA